MYSGCTKASAWYILAVTGNIFIVFSYILQVIVISSYMSYKIGVAIEICAMVLIN